MDLYAIVNGIPYNLNDGTLCRLGAHDGLGMPPLHRLSERGPQQHGESDHGFRLDPRVFMLGFYLSGHASDSAFYDDRQELLNVLKPMDGALSLRFVLDNGETRQIDAFTLDSPMMADAGQVYRGGRIGVIFKASDPTFYHPTEETIVFALGGGGEAWDIPWEIPWQIGAAALDQTRTIEYTGSWRTFPVIKIVGPITDPVVSNLTTGETINFTGTTIAALDYYEVDCRYGYKTVLDSADANQIADLTSGSDLATFHLAGTQGTDTIRENDIQVTGSAVTEATEVYFRYKIRYIGL